VLAQPTSAAAEPGPAPAADPHGQLGSAAARVDAQNSMAPRLGARLVNARVMVRQRDGRCAYGRVDAGDQRTRFGGPSAVRVWAAEPAAAGPRRWRLPPDRRQAHDRATTPAPRIAHPTLTVIMAFLSDGLSGKECRGPLCPAGCHRWPVSDGPATRMRPRDRSRA
jgi:hypothetical protein